MAEYNSDDEGDVKSHRSKMQSRTFSSSPPKKPYTRVQPLYNHRAFIVNIYDPTNFDIDLGDNINPFVYNDVHTSEYQYSEYDENNIGEYVPKIGKTYRCRLRGVTVPKIIKDNKWKYNKLTIEVKKMVDRVDGWVVLTLGDIDVYSRILVDMVIYYKDGSFVCVRDYIENQINQMSNL